MISGAASAGGLHACDVCPAGLGSVQHRAPVILWGMELCKGDGCARGRGFGPAPCSRVFAFLPLNPMQVDRALTELTQAMSSSANMQQNKQGEVSVMPAVACARKPRVEQLLWHVLRK